MNRTGIPIRQGSRPAAKLAFNFATVAVQVTGLAQTMILQSRVMNIMGFDTLISAMRA